MPPASRIIQRPAPVLGAPLLSAGVLPLRGAVSSWGRAMPFGIKGDEALSAKIAVRLSDAEKDQLRADADLAGLSVSELVRRRYFGRPIIAETDMAAIRELTRVAAQQRQLGGLLKQLNAQSDAMYSRQVSDALEALTALTRSIGEQIDRVAQGGRAA